MGCRSPSPSESFILCSSFNRLPRAQAHHPHLAIILPIVFFGRPTMTVVRDDLQYSNISILVPEPPSSSLMLSSVQGYSNPRLRKLKSTTVWQLHQLHDVRVNRHILPFRTPRRYIPLSNTSLRSKKHDSPTVPPFDLPWSLDTGEM